MAVARWLRGRTKLAAVLGLLKDQTAAGVARASGPFSHLQLAIVRATNHQESLPEENYVEDILTAGDGSRMQVSFCTRLLVKRLKKTQNWAVAAKCLVVLHRSILDGGFLFQDLLAFSSLKAGKDYLSFSTSNQASEFCLWVKNYAQFLDERLRCALALKTHLDHRWKGDITQTRLQYMETQELLYHVEALQNLLQELYKCDPGAEAGEHSVIQGALVLVVMDSYKVVDEIRYRITELLSRVKNLTLSESLATLHDCKRADAQMQTLESFLENCKELRLLSDIPLPGKAMVSKPEIQMLTESIRTLQRQPSNPSFTRSVSTGEKGLAGGLLLQSTSRQPFHIAGELRRTSSQPMRQLPRRASGTTREISYIPEDVPVSRHSSANLNELYFNTDSTSHVDKSHDPQHTVRDLITF